MKPSLSQHFQTLSVGWVFILGMQCTAAWADPALMPFLPSSETVKQTLMASPQIAQARANKQALSAQADAIAAGSAEFSVHAIRQQHTIRSTSERYWESTLGIERPIRLWGKSSLDEQIAEKTTALADVEYMDAMHEASRTLLKQWFDALKTQATEINAQQHLEIMKQTHRLAQRRFQLGEISALDAQQALADVQRSQAVWLTAKGQAHSSLTAFARLYPELPAPSSQLLKELTTQALPGALTNTVDLEADFISHHHELILLKMDAQRLSLQAQRHDKDRYPDPTIGIFVAQERDGDERLTGINLSLPLSGAARSHLTQAAYAHALAAQDLVDASQRRLASEFNTLLTQYAHQWAATEQLRLAAQTQTQAAIKARTAYTLGEMTMNELLQNTRLAQEQQLHADLNFLETLALLATIKLDVHQIYDFDE